VVVAHVRAEALSAQRKLAAVVELDRRHRSGEERLGYARVRRPGSLCSPRSGWR